MSPKIPNATTVAAIQEAKEERKTAKTYASFEEAMQHLEENLNSINFDKLLGRFALSPKISNPNQRAEKPQS